VINLRFHIVSIVAIFLALAIGMLAGTTLLDRATVDVLKASQRRLDATNDQLKDENSRLRGIVDMRQPATDAFGASVLDHLLPGTLSDAPTLIVATRGIDEGTVRALQASTLAAGGSPLGIVWLDSRLDLDNEDSLAAVVAALGLDKGDAAKEKSAVVAALTRGLSTSAATLPTGSEPTTTTEPPGAGGTATADQPSLDILAKLVDADLADWESPVDGEPGTHSLPAGGLNLVLLSGEGAELAPRVLMYPLIRALAVKTAGFVVGEVRNPRTDIQVVDDPGVPPRGAFVGPLRRDEALSQRMVTVDNVDEPFGRLASVLALSQLPGVVSGAYGTAASATQPFPPVTK
jgi:hypothetical protein